MNNSKIELLDKPAEILFIDDSKDDHSLIRQAINKSLDKFLITFAESIQLGLDLLRSDDAPDRFDLIILNIEMLINDEYQFLKILQESDRTNNIPVVVLTSTNTHCQLDKSYELGASILIPRNKFLELAPEVIQILVDYWHRLAHVSNR